MDEQRGGDNGSHEHGQPHHLHQPQAAEIAHQADDVGPCTPMADAQLQGREAMDAPIAVNPQRRHEHGEEIHHAQHTRLVLPGDYGHVGEREKNEEAHQRIIGGAEHRGQDAGRQNEGSHRCSFLRRATG